MDFVGILGNVLLFLGSTTIAARLAKLPIKGKSLGYGEAITIAVIGFLLAAGAHLLLPPAILLSWLGLVVVAAIWGRLHSQGTPRSVAEAVTTEPLADGPVMPTAPAVAAELPKQSRRNEWEGGGSIIAKNIKARVLVRYENSDGTVNDRTVSVVRIRGGFFDGNWYPETFFGFCELRQADRFFLFRHVRAAFDPDTGEEIEDLERYLVAHGEQTAGKVVFDRPTPSEAEEAARIDAWLDKHGRQGFHSMLPPPQAIIVATSEGGDNATFEVSVEMIERYGGVAFALIGAARRLDGKGRMRTRRFTLPGFHTPEREIRELQASGAADPVPDVREWLNEMDRQAGRRVRPLRRAGRIRNPSD